MLFVGNKMVEQSMKIVKEKKELWEKALNVKFDKYGRAIFHNDKSKIDGIYDYFKDRNNLILREKFLKAFNIYLKTNQFEFFCRSGYVKNLSSGKEIYLLDLEKNIFCFIKRTKKYYLKRIEIKASKVLAAVNNIWLTLEPEYNEVCKELKRLRKENIKGKEFNDLLDKKELLELNNLYFDFQKILNKKSDENFYISINPLDLLTSSGPKYDDDNPTKFHSCISLSVKIEKTYISFEEDDTFSAPIGTYLLGQVKNVCLIYQKNGNYIKVPKTDFSFIGYSCRSRGWLDTEGIWLEKSYPYRYDLEDFKKMNIPIIKEENLNFNGIHDFSKFFEINDSKGLKRYLSKTEQGLFFDRVGIDNELKEAKLTYLPQTRVDYYEINGGDYLPYDVCNDCSDPIKGIENQDYFIVDNGYSSAELYCKECYEKNICDHCNKYHEEIYEVGNKKYCSDCLDIVAEYCNECQEYILKENVITINGEKYCDTCASGIGFKCEECGEWFLIEDKADSEHYDLCPKCAKNSLIKCDYCGNMTLKKHTHSLIIDGESKLGCYSCYKETDFCYGYCGIVRYPIKDLVLINNNHYCKDCKDKIKQIS